MDRREGVWNLLIGGLVGIASMLPGVSGAVIAVCFGIYERLIADLADFVKMIRKDFAFILLVGIGIVIGMLGISFGIDWLMDNYYAASLLFFLGLIGGQIPMLYRCTKPEEPSTKYNVAALVIGVAIMLVFVFIGNNGDVDIGHDALSLACMVGVGVIFAISKIAPGISGSTVLLALGLYHPLTTALTEFDMTLLIPVGIGLLIGLFGFAKIMNNAMKNHRKSSYFAILGLTLGSLVLIFVDAMANYSGTADLIGGMFALVAGILVSLLFVKIGNGYSSENSA